MEGPRTHDPPEVPTVSHWEGQLSSRTQTMIEAQAQQPILFPGHLPPPWQACSGSEFRRLHLDPSKSALAHDLGHRDSPGLGVQKRQPPRLSVSSHWLRLACHTPCRYRRHPPSWYAGASMEVRRRQNCPEHDATKELKLLRPKGAVQVLLPSWDIHPGDALAAASREPVRGSLSSLLYF